MPNHYNFLMDEFIRNRLRDIAEISRDACGYYSDDSYARNKLHSIRVSSWHVLDSEVPIPLGSIDGWKECRRILGIIKEIHSLASGSQAEGNEREILAKICSICKEVLPKDDY